MKSLSKGFTLVELTVTLGVLAAALAVAVPRYLEWQPDLELKAAVRHLRSDYGLARYRAVSENASVAVVFDTAGSAYSLFVDNGDGAAVGGIADNWVPDGTERILKTVVFPSSVDLYRAAFAGGVSRVRFDGRGVPNGLGGTVYLRNTKHTYRAVSVSMVGRIKVKTSSDDGQSWQDID